MGRVYYLGFYSEFIVDSDNNFFINYYRLIRLKIGIDQSFKKIIYNGLFDKSL